MALLALLHGVPSSGAQAGDDRFRWNYCAPPYPPACVDALAKAPDKTAGRNSAKNAASAGKDTGGAAKDSASAAKDRLACEQAAERYVASVFAYRVCLAGETERAVREANRVLQILKCPIDERYCYDLPQRDTAPIRKPGGR